LPSCQVAKLTGCQAWLCNFAKNISLCQAN
jgi:hypothetical protein